MASIFFGSMRVVRGTNAFNSAPSVGSFASSKRCQTPPRNAFARCAMSGTIGYSQIDSRRNQFSASGQATCSSSRFDSSLASSHGALSAT